MKKIFTFFFALAALAVNAKDYTDDLIVTINGVSTEAIESTISVEEDEDGTYTLSLKNFTLVVGDNEMPIGNITLTEVAAKTTSDGKIKLSASQTVEIENGDDASVYIWYGPLLVGSAPVELSAALDGDEMYASIDVDMSSSLGQIIEVKFGSFISTTESYTDNLVVTLGTTELDPMESTIDVTTVTDSTYTLSLKNFVLTMGGSPMYVGNITVTDIVAEEQGDSIILETVQDVNITAGDLDGVTIWYGTLLGTLEVTVSAVITGDALYAEISLPFSNYGTIYVVFGTDPAGIQTVQTAAASSASDGASYNLQGVKVGDSYKGIVIRNGHKYIQK